MKIECERYQIGVAVQVDIFEIVLAVIIAVVIVMAELMMKQI